MTQNSAVKEKLSPLAPALLADYTQTQKAEAGLGKHGAAHRQDGTDEHDFSQVGQNMPYHDIGAAGSHGALNLYKRQSLELLHPAADDAGRRGPGGDADGQDDVPHAGIQKGHQNDGAAGLSGAAGSAADRPAGHRRGDPAGVEPD